MAEPPDRNLWPLLLSRESSFCAVLFGTLSTLNSDTRKGGFALYAPLKWELGMVRTVALDLPTTFLAVRDAV